MPTDPSYGGSLTYESAIKKLRLTIHVDFDDSTLMPSGMIEPNKVSYRIYRRTATASVELKSPDKKMTLVPGTDTFTQDAYLVIVEGYNGWPNSPKAISQQYFIQAGLSGSQLEIMNSLGEFRLKFDSQNPAADVNTLELCYIAGGTTTDFDISEVPGENAVESPLLTGLGYYALMEK